MYVFNRLWRHLLNWLHTLKSTAEFYGDSWPRKNKHIILHLFKNDVFFSTKRKKYIHVICIFCKLKKKYIRKKKPDLLFMVLEFLICKERRHRTRELIGAPDGVQLSLKLILDDRRLKSVFHHLRGLRFFTPCVFF